MKALITVVVLSLVSRLAVAKDKEPKNLYDFTKGMEYKFVEDSIIITTRLLSNIFPYATNMPVTEDSVLNIQGYSCKKKFSVIMPPMNQYFKKIENWFPENLTFTTNPKANFVMLPTIFFDNQTISLKTKITFSENEQDEETMYVEAVEINAAPLPDTIFAVPLYMKSMSALGYANMQMEKLKKSDLILDPAGSTGKSKNTHNQPTKSHTTKPTE